MEVLLLPQVLDELHDATQFYDNQNSGAAAAFTAEIDRAFELLAENPYLGADPPRRQAVHDGPLPLQDILPHRARAHPDRGGGAPPPQAVVLAQAAVAAQP
jgi:plasmid stabilization system protein ParE